MTRTSTCACRRLQLQPELLLHRGEDRRANRDRSSALERPARGVAASLGTAGRPLEVEIEAAVEPSPDPGRSGSRTVTMCLRVAAMRHAAADHRCPVAILMPHGGRSPGTSGGGAAGPPRTGPSLPTPRWSPHLRAPGRVLVPRRAPTQSIADCRNQAWTEHRRRSWPGRARRSAAPWSPCAPRA